MSKGDVKQSEKTVLGMPVSFCFPSMRPGVPPSSNPILQSELHDVDTPEARGGRHGGMIASDGKDAADSGSDVRFETTFANA